MATMLFNEVCRKLSDYVKCHSKE